MRRFTGAFVKLLLLGQLTAGPGCAGRAGQTPVAGTRPQPETGPVPGRVVVSRVDEHDLVLSDEPAARDYLRRKLVALLARRLGRFGFPRAEAGSLAAGGRLEDFQVQRSSTRIPDGARKVALWNVRGGLRVVLTDRDVEALGERLATLPMNSIEEAEAVAEYVDRMARLKPDRRKYQALRQQVGDRWAETLDPLLQMQTRVPVEPRDEYLASLARLANRLAGFRAAFPGHPEYAGLEKQFARAALNLLKTVEVRAETHRQLEDLLGRLDSIAGDRLPGVMPYLLRDVELAWRNRLEMLAEKQVPFPEVYKDFYLFMQMFPRSDFYPELELMFLAAWCDYLAGREVSSLDELSEYIKEVNLLRVRFPGSASGKPASRVLGRCCVDLLSRAKISDRAALERVQKLAAACDPHIPAGIEAVEMRRYIDRRASRLRREQDDRDEKQALSGLDSFIEWDRALRRLPWGRPREGWTGSGSFAERWKRGRDAGADCRCSLDPQEPCRLFEEEGPHGGFEIVARFFEDRLEGVDLCQVFAGPAVPAVYRFYQRRYRKLHGKRQAAAFLSTNAGSVTFGRGDELRVELERFSDSITVRYRHAPLQARRRRAEKQARRKEQESRRAQREKRIERGWNPGDCVRWDCGAASTCKGTVKTRKANRYQVVVTGSADDPVKLGRYLWVPREALYDCR